MRIIIFFLVVGSLLNTTRGGEPKDPIKNELGQLRGSWTAETLTFNGAITGVVPFSMVFKGDQATIEGNDIVMGECAKFRVTVDPTSKPKHMNIYVTAGSQVETTFKGIYEVKDDELKICVQFLGKERPSELASPNGAGRVLVLLKRE